MLKALCQIVKGEEERSSSSWVFGYFEENLSTLSLPILDFSLGLGESNSLIMLSFENNGCAQPR